MNYQERTVMRPFLSENTANLETLATRYGFSPEAAQTLLQALRAGGGTMAQFSHPELGGAGQWTKGGLIMIGDMFNRTLKARVDGLCSELSHLLLQGQTQTQRHPAAADAENGADHWWGVDLGASVTSGSQNNIRYAYFSATQRLAVLQDRQVTIYDTGSHRITGVSQQQGAAGSLTFTSQHGSVRLTDLSILSVHSTDTPSPEKTSPSRPGRERSAEIFYQIERLAELRDKGILSEDEFLGKKTELLTRL